MAFGRSSERLAREADQLELGLEKAEAKAAARVAPAVARARNCARPYRQPLPDHLPRDDVVHEGPCVCPDYGGTRRRMGEDVTEQLDYVPASFRVVRRASAAVLRAHRAGAAAVHTHGARLPRHRAARGSAGVEVRGPSPALSSVEHLRPLRRRPRFTFADWAGRSARLLDPLVDALERHVMGVATLHADDTPVAVLASGAGRTRTGRLWTYVRDERGAGGKAPPAVPFRYTPDRKAEHPAEHLQAFRGDPHADGYAGINRLYGKQIAEVACCAHVRRKFFDVHAATGSVTAREALDHIAGLYAVEHDVRGRPPDERRCERQTRA